MTDTTDAHDSGADDSQTRRRFLTAATSAVGVGGVAGVAVPFFRVMESLGESEGGRRASPR